MSPFPTRAIAEQRAHGHRQRQLILDFLDDYQAANGWMPTVREVAVALGVGVSTAQAHLHRLHDEGRLILGGGPRMIRVTNGRIGLR